MFRHVLVRLTDTPETEYAVKAALAFGLGYGSTVTGLYVRRPRPVMLHPELPAAALVAAGVPVRHPDDPDPELTEGDCQARLLGAFEDAAARAKVPYHSVVRLGPPTDALTSLARTADLVAMSRGETEAGALSAELERLFRTIPHPFLVASEGVENVRRLAVAYDGSPAAVRALSLAADLVSHWHPRAPEVFLIEVSRMDEDSTLVDAGRYLELYGVPFRALTVHGADVAEAIVQAAVDHDVDLLCMGAFSHGRLREALLGSTTRGVLARRRKPVLLCH